MSVLSGLLSGKFPESGHAHPSSDVFLYRMVHCFARLIREEKTHGYSIYSPTLFIQELKAAYPEFADSKQQDTQEFLVFLLNAIDDEYHATSPSISPASDLYKGLGVDIITCHHCHSQVQHQEEFFTLSLEIPGQDQLAKVGKMGKDLLNQEDLVRNQELQSTVWNRFKGIFSSTAGTVVTLYDCLMSSTLPEILKGAESRFCEKCADLMTCEKQFLITSPPNCLILHLKRFKYSFFGSKINSYVQYPLELQLGSFTVNKSSVRYELCGVIVHSGMAISRGHYTTYRKVEEGWYFFDDGNVRAAEVEEVLNQEAYILFYRLPVEKRPPYEPADFSVTCFIPQYWLLKYEHLQNPGPLSIRHTLCPHGNLSLAYDRSQLTKVSVSFWSAMQAKV